MDELVHALDIDEPGLREFDVKKAVDVGAARLQHPLFQLVEIAGQVRRAHHRAHRSAAHDVRLDALFDQRVDHADM
mgnify:CR=1 FL=1